MLEHLRRSRLFLIIGLIPFAKRLELLAINCGSSERRIIFVPLLLKFSRVLVIFQHVWVRTSPAVELNKVIWFSMLSRNSGFLWHSSKWDCRLGRFLQYTSGVEVLVYVALTSIFMWLICSNCTLLWTSKFLGIFSKTHYVTPTVLSPGHEALCWIFWQNA